MIRLGFGLRCVASLVFAWQLQQNGEWGMRDLIQAHAWFAAVDGALAMAIALLLFAARWDAGFTVAAALDGLIRIAVAVALWSGPGVPYFAVTFVLYVGVLMALAAGLGSVQLMEARRLRRHGDRSGVGTTLMLIAIVTILGGVIGFFLEPTAATFHLLLLGGSILQAVGMLLFVLTLGWRRHRAPDGPPPGVTRPRTSPSASRS